MPSTYTRDETPPAGLGVLRPCSCGAVVRYPGKGSVRAVLFVRCRRFRAVRWCGVGVSAVMFVAAGILAYRHYHDPDYQKHNTKGGAEETQRLMGDGTRRNEMQDPIAGMGTDERLDYGYGAAKQ